MFGRKKQNRAMLAQIRFHSRFKFDLLRKFRIHAGAGGGKGLKRGGSFQAAFDEHTSGGVGGLAAGFSALDNQNAGAAPAQSQREREPDDAAPNNDYVPSLHLGIVKERWQDMG